MRALVAFLFLLCASRPAAALLTFPAAAPLPAASPSAQCRAAIAAAEQAGGVPARLMHAIGVVESGRRDEAGVVGAWPWTINAEGAGSYFATKAEAVAAVRALQAQGVRSIDVGCMQVNLIHHGSAFSSLEEAFDPVANARYAATFLQRLYAQTGSWPGAAAGYHSMNPALGGPYARKVLAIWNAPEPRPQPGAPAPAFASSTFTATPWAAPGMNWPAGLGSPAAPAASGFGASNGTALGGMGRVMPLPGGTVLASASGGTGGPVGRGLDSYRATPTSLVGRAIRSRF